MNKPLLSIIIPTYNRANVLKYTLSLFKEQVARNKDKVELLVCCNASTDNTKDMVLSLQSDCEYIQFVHYCEHVEIGESLVRSASNAKGNYLIIWSDDDIPSPFLIDSLLYLLGKYNDLGCICFNRLEGFSNEISQIEKIFLFDNRFSTNEILYNDSVAFTEKYFGDMSFISVNVIKTELFQKGLSLDSHKHLGFQFLAPILYGIKGSKCLYYEYPLCIERHPSNSGHSYVGKWLLYSQLGIPRMLIDLERLSVISDWKKCFKSFRYYFNLYGYISQIIIAGDKYGDVYRNYKEELSSYRDDRLSKMMTELALSNNRAVRLYAKFLFCLLKPYLIYKSYPKIKLIMAKLKNIIK